MAGALSWGGGGLGSALLLVELGVLAAVLGGVWAAMVLGHWYLVTPRLPEAPLVRFARWLAWRSPLQLVLFVAWVGLGAGPEGTPAFAALVGPWALFVWLRLLVGLVFPLIVSWAAIQTARTRSMESATGLLYINVGTIAAGTILAAGVGTSRAGLPRLSPRRGGVDRRKHVEERQDGWIPDATDLDWIEATGRPLHPSSRDGGRRRSPRDPDPEP